MDASSEETKVALRLGLRYVRGLREDAAQALVSERARAPFTSIHDLTRRVPQLRKDELRSLAEVGALNAIGNSPQNCQKDSHGFSRIRWIQNRQSKIATIKNSFVTALHRRDALWQVERAVRVSGPLLENLSEPDCAFAAAAYES
jgi:error-prone DNA polymerase